MSWIFSNACRSGATALRALDGASASSTPLLHATYSLPSGDSWSEISTGITSTAESGASCAGRLATDLPILIEIAWASPAVACVTISK